jgi:hypothetical protein
MQSFTLDTNCIIALDENRPDAQFIRALIAAHEKGTLIVRAVAIAAAERQKSGAPPVHNISAFRSRIDALGLQSIDLLCPIGYVGICHADFFLAAGPEMLDLERRIHDVLFPNVPYDIDGKANPPGTTAWDRWRNAKCDVLTAWSHIYHRGDVLVTADGKFHAATKKPALAALGAKDIVYPRDLPRKIPA